jgi:glycosyltransferase involved in cell wall biosynthesis
VSTVRFAEVVSGPIEGGILTTIRARVSRAPGNIETLLICPHTSWVEAKATEDSFPCQAIIAGPGLSGVRSLVQSLKRFEPDWILAHTERDLWWAIMLRGLSKSRSKIGYIVHNDLFDARSFVRPFVPLALRLGRPWTSRVVAVSRETREGALGREFPDVTVCFQPPDPSPLCLPPTSREEGPVFLFAKRLVPSKGGDRLIEGVIQAQASLRSVNAKLLIAGNGPQRAMLEEMSVKGGVQDLIDFRGWVPDLPKSLGEVDYFLQPSLHEGASMSLVEAMNAGLRVASSPKGLAREVLIDDEESTLFESIPNGGVWAAWFRSACTRSRLSNDERAVRAERSRALFDPQVYTNLFYRIFTEGAFE